VLSFNKEKSLKVIQWLLDNHKIIKDSEGKLTWHKAIKS
jgi:hypothetical protein